MKSSFSLRTYTTGIAAAIVAAGLAREACAELFLDFGVHDSSVEADIATQPASITTDSNGLHLGVGLRRELTHGSIGARLELDDLDGESLLAVRALDYRRHLSERFALTAFAGAARLDLDTPAYAYYLVGGEQLKDLRPRWSLEFDLRFGDKLARDNFDPQAQRPDDFYDLTGVTIYLSRGF
jgi:hypothetical protein